MGRYYSEVFAGMNYFKNKLFGACAVIVIAVSFIFSLAIAQEKGKLQDVIIKGEKSLKLDSEKPHLDVPVEENKQIYESLETEEEILLKKPTGWEKQPKDSLPELSKSPQVVVPCTHHLRGERVYIFNPLKDLQSVLKETDLKKKKLARWEVLIVNDAGQPFRKYSGQSLPPEKIVFDGRDENGRVLEVGYSYSTVLRYYDVSGGVHTSVGNPFIIQGLVHQENEGFFISLNFNVLYKEEPSVLKKREYSKLGKELFKEAAGWLKKNYFTFPVKVVVYNKNKEIARITAKEISEELAQILLRLKKEVTYEGKMTEKSLGRVEIIVNNR
jgi:hypothetical protein